MSDSNEEGGDSGKSGTSSSGNGEEVGGSGVRDDMVRRAVHFLGHQKTRGSSLSQRVAFLTSKGLRKEEIDAALAQVDSAAAAAAAAAAAERGGRGGSAAAGTVRRVRPGARESKAVVVAQGRGTVYISGQTAGGGTTSLAGGAEDGGGEAKGSVEEQTTEALAKIDQLLKEAGSGKDRLVHAQLAVVPEAGGGDDGRRMEAVLQKWEDWLAATGPRRDAGERPGSEKEGAPTAMTAPKARAPALTLVYSPAVSSDKRALVSVSVTAML